MEWDYDNPILQPILMNHASGSPRIGMEKRRMLILDTGHLGIKVDPTGVGKMTVCGRMAVIGKDPGLGIEKTALLTSRSF